MNVKVISLKRSVERRKEFAIQNPHLDFDFVDAVDGSQLGAQDIVASGWFDEGLAYTPGAYGCAMSHIRMWQLAAESGQVLTVAEDDAIFRADFAAMQQKCLRRLVNDWDIVQWGWNFDSILMLHEMPEMSPIVLLTDQVQLLKGIDHFRHRTSDVNLLRLDKSFGIPAYTLSPSGARKLLDGGLPVHDFMQYFPIMNGKLQNKGIDMVMSECYPGMLAYISFPPLVISRNERPVSTVQVAD